MHNLEERTPKLILRLGLEDDIVTAKNRRKVPRQPSARSLIEEVLQPARLKVAQVERLDKGIQPLRRNTFENDLV